MYVMREILEDDLDGLFELATHLDTLNLPADRKRLASIIAESRASFSKTVPTHDRIYLFALLEGGEHLIGTCMIIGQHGTFERPSIYFDVREEQKYSTTLEKLFVHQVLQIVYNFDGASEIGGLILHPDYQRHRLKLGKLLSFVRFLFIGMHRSEFRDEIVAELLPHLNEDGTSDLWECLGANFTKLDYRTADKMSRENVEFIRSLFPQTPIYTALLPEEVRELIGVVGEPTKPVEKMLRSIGFEWDKSIDPFDGGPTFVCRTDDCRMVQRTHLSTVAGVLEGRRGEGRALIGVVPEDEEVRFRSALARYKRGPEGYRIDGECFEDLELEEGDAIGIMPLSGPDIKDFYRVKDDPGEWKKC